MSIRLFLRGQRARVASDALLVVVEEREVRLACLVSTATLVLLPTKSHGLLHLAVPLAGAPRAGRLVLGGELGGSDRSSHVAVLATSWRRASRRSGSGAGAVVVVEGAAGGTAGVAVHSIAHVRTGLALVLEPRLVEDETRDVLGLLTDVRALVLTGLVEVLEFLEGLNDVQVLTEVEHAVVAPGVKAVVEEGERFEDMTPVLALVVEPLVKHLHDLHKVGSARQQGLALETYWLYVSAAISLIWVPEGPHASFEVASRTLVCTSE